MSRPKAFTLVELLVVLAIILVLISIVLPAMSQALQSAGRTNCLAQQRQLHLSLMSYAHDHRGQVPLGYRTASKQFNSMVYSTTAGGKWVLFGLLREGGYLPDRRVLYCPAESNSKFMFNTAENPWPATGPVQNIQAGYAMRPDHELPDAVPADVGRYLPILRNFKNHAVLADLTAARQRVIARHGSGVNVLYGNGAAKWVPLSAFDQAGPTWPEPSMPPASTFNGTQDLIWSAFDQQ